MFTWLLELKIAQTLIFTANWYCMLSYQTWTSPLQNHPHLSTHVESDTSYWHDVPSIFNAVIVKMYV